MPTETEVRSLVRQILTRLQTTETTGDSGTLGASATRQSRVIGAEDIGEMPRGSALDLPAGSVVTPLAFDTARERGIDIRMTGTNSVATGTVAQRAVAIAADHGGYRLKEELKPYLAELGYETVDVGTNSSESVDYPDYAYAAANLVAQGRCCAAIIVDGAGIGSCMAANKIPGIRASMCYDVSTASNAREHNHANVLTLGAGLIGSNAARQIVKTWLTTPWGGSRHARRVDKIMAIEKRFSKA